MAIRNVLELGDPFLRKPSRTVTDFDDPNLQHLIEDMVDTLRHWRATTTYGRGIAATQIGRSERVIFVEIDEPWVLVNPQIVDRSVEEVKLWDACLSFLTFFFQVPRNLWVEVEYQDLHGDRHRLRAQDALAELLQHEIDHLDGILAVDRIVDIKTICTKGEFEAWHRSESPYSVEGNPC